LDGRTVVGVARLRCRDRVPIGWRRLPYCRAQQNAQRNLRSLDALTNASTSQITRCSRPLRARATIACPNRNPLRCYPQVSRLQGPIWRPCPQASHSRRVQRDDPGNCLAAHLARRGDANSPISNGAAVCGQFRAQVALVSAKRNESVRESCFAWSELTSPSGIQLVLARPASDFGVVGQKGCDFRERTESDDRRRAGRRGGGPDSAAGQRAGGQSAGGIPGTTKRPKEPRVRSLQLRCKHQSRRFRPRGPFRQDLP
jgi:hypothetical protein